MDIERIAETATTDFDTNRAIVETFGAAGYPVPEKHLHMRQAEAKAAG